MKKHIKVALDGSFSANCTGLQLVMKVPSTLFFRGKLSFPREAFDLESVILVLKAK